MCNDNKDCKCIAEILTTISILQQNANCCDNSCLDTCDRNFLGNTSNTLFANTRPIMLYTCGSNGVPLEMPISKNPTETTTSTIFRVEKIDGCCATFRVLTLDTEATETTYLSTNSFFTMNLNCCCLLRCLNDTYIDCI